MAKPASASTTNSASGVMISPVTIFTILTQVPDMDMQALGFIGLSNHPCNAIIVTLPVLPPVSRPSMRTLDRTGSLGHPNDPMRQKLENWTTFCC